MKFLPLFFIPLAITACSSQPAANSMSLAGSEWGTEIQGQFIQFSGDGTVYGNGGCNGFGARYTQNGITLSITPVRSTEMACGNLPQERDFFGALQKTVSVEASHLKLTLKDSDGAALLILRRRDWD